MSLRYLPMAVLTLCAASAAWAGESAAGESPAALRDLVACRGLADSAERLACYDRQVAQIDTAARSGDLVIADREQVRETRRGLFGFSLPNIGKLFGGGDNDDEDADTVREIETTIAGASQFGYGSWRLRLADGAVWEQTDSQQLVFNPAVGDAIRIRRAALGSYLANVAGQRAIRMRRVQ